MEALLKGFRLPSMLQVRMEFVDDDAEAVDAAARIERLFGPPPQDQDQDQYEPADWVLVVPDSTYVNLERLARRLFADVDPASAVSAGLLSSSADGAATAVPDEEAGILFTSQALELAWGDGNTCSASNSASSFDAWAACLATGENAFVWTGLPGLNTLNPRELMRYALEGTLFSGSLNRTYSSVGGAIAGTARLPITYGNMDDELFYHQLAVDTHRGEVPKIL